MSRALHPAGWKPTDLPERLATKIEVDAVTGCWLWNGLLMRGYGSVRWSGKKVVVHRLTYHLLSDNAFPAWSGGPFAGLQLDHLCEVRNCVNPAHLEPVTHAENMRRIAIRHPRPTRLTDDDPRHGRLGGYTRWKCRCEPCRAAWRVYLRGWRASKRAEAAHSKVAA